jgi:AraC-like DNA-binding protein
MEVLTFNEVVTKDLKCKLLSYHRIDMESYHKALEGMPAYANCILAAIHPETDRIEHTYFIPQGAIFDKKALSVVYESYFNIEVIFFNSHIGSIPIFSVAELKPVKIDTKEHFSPFFTLLRFETINSHFLREHIVELTLETMSMHVLRNLNEYYEDMVARLNQYFGNERLFKVLSYIHENLDKEISMEILGAEAGLSPDYVSQYFKRCLGLSIQSYLMDQRVKDALFKLVSTNEPLFQIAEQSAFVDQAYFNRRFKKFYNVIPLKVRKHYERLFRQQHHA